MGLRVGDCCGHVAGQCVVVVVLRLPSCLSFCTCVDCCRVAGAATVGLLLHFLLCFHTLLIRASAAAVVATAGVVLCGALAWWLHRWAAVPACMHQLKLTGAASAWPAAFLRPCFLARVMQQLYVGLLEVQPSLTVHASSLVSCLASRCSTEGLCLMLPLPPARPACWVLAASVVVSVESGCYAAACVHPALMWCCSHEQHGRCCLTAIAALAVAGALIWPLSEWFGAESSSGVVLLSSAHAY